MSKQLQAAKQNLLAALREAAESGDTEAFQRLVEGADPGFGAEIEAVADEYFDRGAEWIRPFLPKAKAKAKAKAVEEDFLAELRAGKAARHAVLDAEIARLRALKEAKKVGVPPVQPPDEVVVKFDKRDHQQVPKEPMTLDQRDGYYEVLADLWGTEPTQYEEKKRWLGKELGLPLKTIEREVKLRRDERKEGKEDEISQAAKIIAIGMGEDMRLWHSPVGNAYASVLVGEHWENYRIGGSPFDQVLRAKYGKQNQIKIRDKWVWQGPGAGALKDGKASLEAYAKFQGAEREPAIRVGGGGGVIWIDLGGPDWHVVKVTPEGWEVQSRGDVAFIRTGTMLGLPVPVRGGNVNDLRRVLNIREEEFVLVPGWMLQALNPVGPYPFLNMWGEAEHGKTTVTKLILRCVDPNSAGLRRVRKEEDVIIAAKNNWTIGLDNMSSMGASMSDLFCTLATGISYGGRRLYSDDDENVFTVERPAAFNGIPGDLVERADLASRLIKIFVPPLMRRRTEAMLGAEFQAIWPGVFGALLDGLVAGLRDGRGIAVADPARLMDFEQFAEAGCRRMGFQQWEFVDAYAVNRKGGLITVAEGHPVARAITAYMEKHPDGFVGRMSALFTKLGWFKVALKIADRDWPKDPARLSSELSRIRKPLAAVGISVETVDRRPVGSQKDIVLGWLSR